MKKLKIVLLISILLTLYHLIPNCLAENYSYSYEILDHPNGLTHYRLNVLVQQSLYDYYVVKNHKVSSNADFAKFVTPYALKPIADCLWRIYNDEEDFVNGVLMIVHQIPYEMTAPTKYPVETIAENKGDCDLFSYIAASIIKAGGINVVLLYYETQKHMNIGVSLSHAPYDAREQAYYVTFGQTRYYMCEVTGGDWQNGWRVGECPDVLKNVPVEIITLENCEQSTQGQVSASYKTLASSKISLTVSPTYLIQEGMITLSGQLSPTLQNQTVTIYIKANNSPWIVLDTVTTNYVGGFTYVWNVEATGICYIRACWSGNDEYAGADSPIQTVTILSTFFILLLIVTAIIVGIGVVIFLISRQPQQNFQEPEPPEITSFQRKSFNLKINF